MSITLYNKYQKLVNDSDKIKTWKKTQKKNNNS